MKLILVLDEMPISCSDCPCFYDELDKCQVMWWHGDEEKRPGWGPLKEMPERLHQHIIDEKPVFDKYYIGGWNDCLEVIEK